LFDPVTHDSAYLLGYIVKTHGTKGELSIHLDVDYPEDYEEMDSVFVEIKGELVPYFIDTLNLQRQQKAIVRFEDVDTIEKAQLLVGSALYLPIEALEELEDGQFYYHDIPGYQVVDQQQGPLGIVGAVYTPGSQDLIAMEYLGNEVLIPIVDDIVLGADNDKKELYVNLPEGLLEVYLEKSEDEENQDIDED
jgi:16S rRNA processing protein RimM